MASKHGGLSTLVVCGSKMEGRGGRDKLWNSSAPRVPPQFRKQATVLGGCGGSEALSLTQQQPAAAP